MRGETSKLGWAWEEKQEEKRNKYTFKILKSIIMAFSLHRDGFLCFYKTHYLAKINILERLWMNFDQLNQLST